MDILKIDLSLLKFFQKYWIPMARFGLFIIFFWFGILKVFGLSPASELVQKLFEATISFMSFKDFIVYFGIFECIIGVLFLKRGLERIVLPLLLVHMITTFMPLFIIPDATWSDFLVPTLEGQYIIKNLVIIACAMGIASQLRPIHKYPFH